MKKPVKIALGIAAIVPFPAMLITFAAFFWFVSSFPDPKELIRFFEQHDIAIGLFNLALTAFFGGLHLIFIVHSARNQNLGSMKTTWVVCIIIFGAFVFPFYWYHHIWYDEIFPSAGGPLGLSDG